MTHAKEGALKAGKKYPIREIQREIAGNPVCPKCGELIDENNDLIVQGIYRVFVPARVSDLGTVTVDNIDIREVENALIEEFEEGLVEGCERCA